MSTYTGTPFGTINAAYYDQMGTALAGDLANASDSVLADSIAVSETNGIPFGAGVIVDYVASYREGIDNRVVSLPAGSETEDDFAGIVVRANTGQTDSSGVAMVADTRMALVARPNRDGFRMWVKAQSTITAGDDVYWIIKDDTGHGLPIGSFYNAAITVSGTTDTVHLTKAQFKSGSTVAKGIALVEMSI